MGSVFKLGVVIIITFFLLMHFMEKEDLISEQNNSPFVTSVKYLTLPPSWHIDNIVLYNNAFYTSMYSESQNNNSFGQLRTYRVFIFDHNGIFGLKSILKWLKLSDDDRCIAEFTQQMETEVDNYYLSNYYYKFFRSPEHVDILPNIPGIYMWDDHEIFDGYGSYPEKIQNCDIMKNIFRIAKKYFCLFQLHMDIIDPSLNLTSYYKINNTLLINVDTRTNRSIKQIIPDNTYNEIFVCTIP